ncbi:MAG: hypothetical protein EOO12_07085 [Chitinophagaceae bacterium]|nr:MAG: hypothetical protein EOO12_07085 [Chitinophagaceae bacterium]
MRTRYLFFFVTCFAVLVGSEYFFVTEAFNSRRLAVLLFSGSALLGSIVVSWWGYRKFRKAIAAVA